MNPANIKLYNQIFNALEQMERQLPSFPSTFLDSLIAHYDPYIPDKPCQDWVDWMVKANNGLFHQYTNEASLQWLRPFHELLAQLVINYDALREQQHPLMATSIFMRDCRLLRHYDFHPFPLIKKYIRSALNIPIYKTIYYKDDPVFETFFSSNPDDKPSEGEDLTLGSPQLKDHCAYMNDPYFKLIVSHYTQDKTSHTKFAGISIAKGGLFNVLHIILDKAAHIRFLGGIAPSLKTESAYSHGPIFMVVNHLNQTPNADLFSLPLAHIIFIIPEQEMRATLKQLLLCASRYGLISIEEIHHVLENQILTYQEYWHRHCPINITVELLSEPQIITSPCNTESTARTNSELLTGSPLSFPSRVPSFGKHPFFSSTNSRLGTNNPKEAGNTEELTPRTPTT